MKVDLRVAALVLGLAASLNGAGGGDRFGGADRSGGGRFGNGGGFGGGGRFRL